MNREERSSVEDDQREHGTMDDEGRKKQVQVTRRSLRHKVTSVDANMNQTRKPKKGGSLHTYLTEQSKLM